MGLRRLLPEHAAAPVSITASATALRRGRYFMAISPRRVHAVGRRGAANGTFSGLRCGRRRSPFRSQVLSRYDDRPCRGVTCAGAHSTPAGRRGSFGAPNHPDVRTPPELPDRHRMDALKQTDPDIHRLLVAEADRQEHQLEMIASENFVSQAVLQAMGSVLTNKYAEGYPGKRYYGGCEVVDEVEKLAQERLLSLFGAEHANVQPHSGAQANMAVFFALMEPGDTMLGMNLSEGGHLTHGSPVNFSGRLYNVVAYGVRPDDHRIDYAALRDQAMQVRPKVIVAGASAYPRQIDFETFGEIARECGAKLVVDMAHIAGLVATGHHPSPVPFADVVTSTTHKTLRGPRGGLILSTEEHAKAIDKQIFPGIQGGPLMHVIAAKAVAFAEALRPEFGDYSGRVIAN